MITRETLSDLTFFDPREYLTTTLYLQLDGSATPSHSIVLKDLIRDRKQDLEKQDLPDEIMKSVQNDFKAIQDFVTLKFSQEGARTLVLFSCSSRKWWKEVTLGLPVRSQLVVQNRPHLTPLTMVLEDFQRFLVILIERAKARLFEVYAGEIQEHSGVLNEVPARVKRGGFGGSEERRIERHIDDHVRRHFKNVADKANELVRRSGVDFLILGGTDQNVHDFHYYLNNVLHDKLAGQIQEDQNATPKTVLAKTLKIEQDLRQKNEKKLLDRFFGRIRSGGLALLGLDPTIRALQQGQVNTIVIQDGYARSGYRCKACSSLLANNTSCDYCGGATERVNDIVDAAIQEALQQGCNVKFITLDDSPLAAAGSIGALLRFRL